VVCGISRAQWFRLAASGRTPLPVRLGTRRLVYIISELESWLKAGAPDREIWLRMRAAAPAGK
jgi:predicted DNA-binding transcriptional regulator AlpA